MRILIIHNQYQQAGGEDTALKLQVELFKENNHDVEVCLFSNDAIQGIQAKIISAVNGLYNTNAAHRVAEIIQIFKPDIIHIHNLFFIASPSVLFQAFNDKIPVVITLHNYRLVCPNALLMRDNTPCELCINKFFPWDAIRYSCYRSSAIETALVGSIVAIHRSLGTWQNKVAAYITLTDFAKTIIMRSKLGIAKEKLVTLPNYTSNQTFGEVAKRQDFYLFVGRMSSEKGVEVLVSSFLKMPQLKLIIVGDGPLKKSLETSLPENSTINFVGKKNSREVIELMQQCKALVFPSIWYEGLPYTILEAFSTGTPIISSNLGAMAEMIVDRYNGFHFKPNDPDDLIKAVMKLEEPTQEVNNLYSNARKTYEEKYTQEVHYQRLMTLYKSVIKSK